MSNPDRIIQLDDATIGHIAAGEVVERPAQVVKELLENSLDAGSEHLSITIERGGFDLIRVQDDGRGIAEQDLHLALDRHATSKLKKAEDLNSIHTLGFRGEALASIGMVPNFKCPVDRKVQKENQSPDKWVRKVEPLECSTAQFLLLNICSETPAFAFQRRPATENSRVVDVVVAHAMAQKCWIQTHIDERVMLDTQQSRWTDCSIFWEGKSNR